MTEDQVDKFNENYKAYLNIWEKASNKYKATGTSLNHELDKRSKNFSLQEVQEYAERKLDYIWESRRGTKRPMTTVQYDQKLQQILRRLKRKIRVQFRKDRDIKFRFFTRKFEYFYIYLPLVMEILNANLELKEYILGASMKNFEFDQQWLTSMQKFMINHSQQISRCETEQEADNNSFWELCDEIVKYCFGIGEDNLPLTDPFKM